MAVAGLVLGILSIVSIFGYNIPIMFVMKFFLIIFAIIGLPLSAAGKVKLKYDGKSTGMGTAGLLLNIVGLCLSFIMLFRIFRFYSYF